jgi:hypothetical protein
MRTWRAGILHRAKFKIARNSRSTVAILRRHRPEAGGGALLNTLPRKSLLRFGGGWQAGGRSVEECHCTKSER